MSYLTIPYVATRLRDRTWPDQAWPRRTQLHPALLQL